MIQITRLPQEVKRFLEPLRAWFSYRHFLVFCWLIVAHLVCFEQATCKALGCYTPKHVGWWHLRRLLACGRWPWEEVLYWLVTQALAAFPPPDDGVLYLVVDSTLKGKRTKKNPLVKKGRLNEYAPFTWGLHVVLEPAALTLAGAFVWLMIGRDSSLECSLHPGPPGVPERS